MSIPEDVLEIVLPYLSFYDTVISFQPTCKLWWNTAQQYVVNVDVNFVYTKRFHTPLIASEPFMRIIERRFPNVQILNLRSCSTRQRSRYPTACKDLRIITHNSYHFYDSERGRSTDLYSIFPMYSGLYATLNRISDEEKAQSMQQLVENREITHLWIGSQGWHKNLSELLHSTLPKLTKLTNLKVQSKDKILVKEVTDLLPIQEHVTTVSTNFLSVIQKCPNLERLELLDEYYQGLFLDHSEMQHKKSKIVELKTRSLRPEILKQFPNLKRLGENIRLEHFPIIFEHCPLLEEVHISSCPYAHLLMLIENLPRLRFIFTDFGEIEGFVMKRGIIDVKRTKETMSVEQPARKRVKLE